jgi:hypothetical protein
MLAVTGMAVMTMIGWAESGVPSMPSMAAATTTTVSVTPAAPLRIDTGDTAWVLISTALVMLMTPGLAFFYGGLVRRKNVLSILMQCFVALCMISLQWVFFGYSLAFGPDKGGVIGSLAWAFLKGVGLQPNADYAATIPHQVFMIFQMMFAVITPALILGAFAERMKFSSFCVFILLWATLVYDPVAHWVWGVGGFLRNLGALDFAGGIVVHINAGIAALVCALVLGRRRLCGHPCSRGHGGIDLDSLGPAFQLPPNHAGSHHRRRGRPGRHYTGGRICQCGRGPGHRHGSGWHLFPVCRVY